ncbi:MAG: deoxynucleoside kinase [Oscillospiraceae bacterium]|jgi:dTMP kinase|nr:deoxynucleoside kinase [Oscillospiraceae bacterium]
MLKKSNLIVIEGLDGSGKATQTRFLCEALKADGYNVKLVSLPDYESASSWPARMYLQGSLCHKPEDMNVYAVSSFFAVDRFINFHLKWKREYESGRFIILCDRYVTSNTIYQLAKLPRSGWKDFVSWLGEYEYARLALPQPDAVIYLDVPVEVSQNLINNRGKVKDLHELGESYLKKCREAALYAVHEFDWNLIDCKNSYGAIKPKETITEELKRVVYKILDKLNVKF